MTEPDIYALTPRNEALIGSTHFHAISPAAGITKANPAPGARGAPSPSVTKSMGALKTSRRHHFVMNMVLGI